MTWTWIYECLYMYLDLGRIWLVDYDGIPLRILWRTVNLYVLLIFLLLVFSRGVPVFLLFVWAHSFVVALLVGLFLLLVPRGVRRLIWRILGRTTFTSPMLPSFRPSSHPMNWHLRSLGVRGWIGLGMFVLFLLSFFSLCIVYGICWVYIIVYLFYLIF